MNPHISGKNEKENVSNIDQKSNWLECKMHLRVVIMETAVLDVEVLEGEAWLVSRERVFLGHDNHVLSFNTVRFNSIILF